MTKNIYKSIYQYIHIINNYNMNTTHLHHQYKIATDAEKSICAKNITIETEQHPFIDYNRKVCVKPWGHEFLAYQSKSIGIWYLTIKKGHKTSLHCHFNKDTLIVVLKGALKVDLHNSSPLCVNELESIFLPHYNFHGLGAYSDEVHIIEIEVYNKTIDFTDKNDLLRIKDIYQREHIGYDASVQLSYDLAKYGWFSLNETANHCVAGVVIDKITINSKNSDNVFRSINKSNYNKIILLDGELYNGSQYIRAGSIISGCFDKGLHLLNNKIELLCFKNAEALNNKKIIYDNEQLETIVKGLKNAGQQIVLTSGCFDIVHVGHMNTLKNAKQLGDVLMVCLSSDEQIKKLKGESRPINNYQDRIDLFKTVNYVDYIILYNEENIEKEYTLDCIMNLVEPDYWVKGDDYKEEDILKKHPSLRNIALFKNVENKSTSKIIQKIQEEK